LYCRGNPGWNEKPLVGQHEVVTVLVDEAIWPWRGGRWAHLVSDQTIAELHDFAVRLGLRRMSFQGDHYDVTAAARSEAIAMGAEAVGGRDLVRRLRTAGLRLAATERPGHWEKTGLWPPVGVAPDLGGVVPDRLVEALDGCVFADWHSASVAAYSRRSEVVVVVESAGGLAVEGPLPVGVEVRCNHGRVLELFVPVEG
tara:strand:+ start:278 stop:874 length:597 start_codon:yes stop_codon:yes gene_type:complete